MSDKQPDLRFNTRELIGIFVMLVVVSSLIFGLGVFVGKGMSETKALLFLKDQFKKSQMAERPAVGTNSTPEVSTSPVPSNPDPDDGGEVAPATPDDSDDDLDEESVETSKEGTEKNSDPIKNEVIPVVPKKQIKSGKIEIPLGINKGEVKEALLNENGGVPYKGDMAKIYNDDSPLFTIVLLNTMDRAKAEAMVRTLGGEIEGVYMDIRETGGKAPLKYRVLLGKYASEGQAKSVAMALKVHQKINGYDVKKLD